MGPLLLRRGHTFSSRVVGESHAKPLLLLWGGGQDTSVEGTYHYNYNKLLRQLSLLSSTSPPSSSLLVLLVPSSSLLASPVVAAGDAQWSSSPVASGCLFSIAVALQ